MLSATFEKMYGTCPYKSPTDMGVNMVGNCIVDDAVVRRAANLEIIRRYYQALVSVRKGEEAGTILYKHEIQMQRAKISPADRPVIAAALAKRDETNEPAAAIELPDGTIVTGKTSNLMGPAAAALLNALKKLGGINDEFLLLPPVLIEPLQKLKTENFGSRNPRLHADEILMALAISATTNPVAALAMEQLNKLRGCQSHISVIVSSVDKNVYRKLGIDLTCDPVYESKKFYHQ